MSIFFKLKYLLGLAALGFFTLNSAEASKVSMMVERVESKVVDDDRQRLCTVNPVTIAARRDYRNQIATAATLPSWLAYPNQANN